MTCEHIQEILLSDYHDGQLSDGKRKEIDVHLHACAACRTFNERLLSQAIAPFDAAQAVMPDEFNWSQIKRRITQQPAPAPRAWVWQLRPVFLTGSLVVLLLIGGLAWRQYTTYKTPYLTYMLASDTEPKDDVSKSIEEYFL